MTPHIVVVPKGPAAPRLFPRGLSPTWFCAGHRAWGAGRTPAEAVAQYRRLAGAA